MNSLRSRLILGSALVAIIPLAIAMVLLSQRVERMVRTQAAERLDAALIGVEARLAADSARSEAQMRFLARDPQLKRLYLVRPTGSRDLADYLAERRVLLGLDFLQAVDISGAVAAEGTTGATSEDAARVTIAVHDTTRGLRIVPLAGDSALAIVAVEAILYQNRTAGFISGGRLLDDGFLARLKQASGVDLVLRDASGRAVASTLGSGPRSIDAAGPALPADAAVARVVIAGRPFLARGVALPIGAPPHAAIAALISTTAADHTIAALQLTSVLLGLLGLAIAVLLGVLWSSQISRPVERLAAFSHRVARGEWDEPLTLHSVRELETLVAALDTMRSDLKSYRDRLVVSERQAAWGQMARKVAHEINNPLTPIGISVADLQRSYRAQRDDFPQILDQAVRTVTEEVATLKRLLREFADFARLPAPLLAPCRLSILFADLATLYGRDVAEGRLIVNPPDPDVTFDADAGQLRQAFVNLIKNGLEAVDGAGQVTLSATIERDALALAVADTGPALTAEQRAHLFEPGFTTKTHGSGLGLTIVERIVSEHRGSIRAESGGERGTTFRIRLPLTGANAPAPGPNVEGKG
jgi:two-component system nitrogen regulation sensor histidine kinase NtrY